MSTRATTLNNLQLFFTLQIMSSQPKVENLVKGFVWAQLDQYNKRLYYVYSEVNPSIFYPLALIQMTLYLSDPPQ